MDTVLSAIQASENKVLNEITLLLSDTVFGLQRQFNSLCQFCKVKKKTEGEHTQNNKFCLKRTGAG